MIYTVFYPSFSFSSLWNVGLQKSLSMCSRCTMAFWRTRRLQSPLYPYAHPQAVTTIPLAQDPAAVSMSSAIVSVWVSRWESHLRVLFLMLLIKCWKSTVPVWLYIFHFYILKAKHFQVFTCAHALHLPCVTIPVREKRVWANKPSGCMRT